MSAAAAAPSLRGPPPPGGKPATWPERPVYARTAGHGTVAAPAAAAVPGAAALAPLRRAAAFPVHNFYKPRGALDAAPAAAGAAAAGATSAAAPRFAPRRFLAVRAAAAAAPPLPPSRPPAPAYPAPGARPPATARDSGGGALRSGWGGLRPPPGGGRSPPGGRSPGGGSGGAGGRGSSSGGHAVAEGGVGRLSRETAGAGAAAPFFTASGGGPGSPAGGTGSAAAGSAAAGSAAAVSAAGGGPGGLISLVDSLCAIAIENERRFRGGGAAPPHPPATIFAGGRAGGRAGGQAGGRAGGGGGCGGMRDAVGGTIADYGRGDAHAPPASGGLAAGRSVVENLGNVSPIENFRGVFVAPNPFSRLVGAIPGLRAAPGNGRSPSRHRSGDRKSALPTVLFDAFRAARHGETCRCSICLEEFRHQDRQSFLPCLHSFHKRCIAAWLRQSDVCPICLLDVRKLLRVARVARGRGVAPEGKEIVWCAAARGAPAAPPPAAARAPPALAPPARAPPPPCHPASPPIAAGRQRNETAGGNAGGSSGLPLCSPGFAPAPAPAFAARAPLRSLTAALRFSPTLAEKTATAAAPPRPNEPAAAAAAARRALSNAPGRGPAAAAPGAKTVLYAPNSRTRRGGNFSVDAKSWAALEAAFAAGGTALVWPQGKLVFRRSCLTRLFNHEGPESTNGRSTRASDSRDSQAESAAEEGDSADDDGGLSSEGGVPCAGESCDSADATHGSRADRPRSQISDTVSRAGRPGNLERRGFSGSLVAPPRNLSGEASLPQPLPSRASRTQLRSATNTFLSLRRDDGRPLGEDWGHNIWGAAGSHGSEERSV